MPSINRNIYTNSNYPSTTPNVTNTEVTPTSVTVSSTASSVPTPTSVIMYTAVAPDTPALGTSKSMKKELKKKKKEAERYMNDCYEKWQKLQSDYELKFRTWVILCQDPYFNKDSLDAQCLKEEILELDKKKNEAALAYDAAYDAYEAAQKAYDDYINPPVSQNKDQEPSTTNDAPARTVDAPARTVDVPTVTTGYVPVEPTVS